MVKLAVLAAVAGCGRINFDPVAATADSGSGTGCAQFGPFATPQPLEGINTNEDDWGPWLSDDRLELFFSQDTGGNPDQLYRAHRSIPQGGFDQVAPLSVNTPDSTEDPFLSNDGLTLWWDVDLDPDPINVFVATRADRSTVTFTTPVELDLGVGRNTAPGVTADLLTLVFDSDRAGDVDIWMARRSTPSDVFANPTRIEAVSGVGNDSAPWISPDGTTLLFNTARITGDGMNRIVEADGGPDNFGSPYVVPNIYKDGSDVDPFMTSDGTTLVFASSRSGGAGQYDIYTAVRACLD